MLYLFLTSYFSFDFWPPRFCVTSVSHQHIVGDSHKRGKHDLHPTSHGPLYRQIFLFWKNSKVWNPLLVRMRERKNKSEFLLYNFTIAESESSDFCLVFFFFFPEDFLSQSDDTTPCLAYHNWCCVCVPKGSTFFWKRRRMTSVFLLL